VKSAVFTFLQLYAIIQEIKEIRRGKIMNAADKKFISDIREYAEGCEIKTLLDSCDNGKKLEPLFAAVCRAAEEGLGQTPFDEQLLAARALTEYKILELPTGEGKTLCAVFAAVWHRLCGRRVHILTFNDYLAERDKNWMSPVYELLDTTVAYVTEQTPLSERRSAYRADVLYISAKERCFDYLRDFTVQSPEEAVGEHFEAAIVDEADSLLIDEARIPMVVAGDTEVKPDPLLSEVSEFIKSFSENDYEISLEAESVYLTDEGASKAESRFGVDNLYDEENSDLLGKINDCLKACFFLKEDVDYIDRDGQIQLIDKFTGRIAKNRIYPGMLQSAVELKHDLHVTTRGVIMGSIALQYFIRKYDFLAAMTGTAEASKDEFFQIYGLTFEKGEPHLPSRRIDNELEIYRDADSKWNAVAKAVELAHKKGQPVLVGTGSISDSELLRDLLKDKGITASVLNAKNDRKEAEVISNAGAPYAITISTNMAGRGVDIRLGGSDESKREEALKAGGLLVISTYMPESSRIVKQLIGRTGRQGDPGESRRFVSLDEPIMDKYKLKSLVPSKHIPDSGSDAIEDKVLLREVERVQRISEGDGFDIRARLMKFTMIGEKHREQIFKTKNRILYNGDVNIWKTSTFYSDAVVRFGEDTLRELERKTALAAINRLWSDYLEYTEGIRRGIHLMEVGGKSPSEEYNIIAEDYYEGMENELRHYMLEQLEHLLDVGPDNYKITVPENIRTYLLEDTGDELNKMPFLFNVFGGENEDEQKIGGSAEKAPSVLEKSENDAMEKKKGFLFWKKKK